MTPHDDDLRAALDGVVRLFPSLSIDLLKRHVREILRWNDEVGLVSKKDPLGVCARLMIESAEFGAVVAGRLARDARVADVGSGAGFPGVVWRLLYPEWDLVLIERREKRAVFLQQTARHLALARLEVLSSDAQDVSRIDRYRASFDLVATMAVGEPARTAPLVQDLLMAGGIFATTLPEETAAPACCGRNLILVDDVRAEFGRYGLYRNG